MLRRNYEENMKIYGYNLILIVQSI